ncbi:MAG: peptidylprolyl isomerase [Magnetococcales bacterium]|nr:peptidylprolyl isomerase [Magnetococcales bacterium]
MKKFSYLPLIALILAWESPAMASDLPSKSEKSLPVVAEMGGVMISDVEWEAMKKRLDPNTRSTLEKEEQARTKFIQDALIKKFLLSQARSVGFDKKPQVQEEFDRLAEQSLLAQYVAAQSEPAANYPSEAELASFYEHNKDSLRQPGQVHVAQIFLAVPPDADETIKKAVRERSYQIFKEVMANPKKFGDIAKVKSDHKESAAKGGDMGWLAGNQLLPEMVTVLAALQPYEIGFPVQSSGGWHILRLFEVKKGDFLPLAAVKESLVNALRRQESQKREQEFLKQLIEKNPPTITAK